MSRGITRVRSWGAPQAQGATSPIFRSKLTTDKNKLWAAAEVLSGAMFEGLEGGGRRVRGAFCKPGGLVSGFGCMGFQDRHGAGVPGDHEAVAGKSLSTNYNGHHDNDVCRVAVRGVHWQSAS